MFNWGVRRRNFIVNEADVTTVIKVINEHRKNYEVQTNNCGWADEPDKWFVAFEACDEEYGHIVEDLNNLGTFSLNVSPNYRVVDLCYERAH